MHPEPINKCAHQKLTSSCLLTLTSHVIEHTASLSQGKLHKPEAAIQSSSYPAHLDKAEDCLDDLPALGAQQHEDRGQQVGSHRLEPPRKLKQQAGEGNHCRAAA